MQHERSAEALNRPSGALARLEVALMAISAIAMAAIMMVVVIDVAMRYVFSSPLSWSYDLVGLYLMVAVFFLALPDTLHHHGHIAVDLFQNIIPFRLRHLFLGIGYGLSTAVMVLIAWGAADRLAIAFVKDERLAATVPWPTWIAYLIVAAGSAAMVLRCTYRTGGHLASALANRELVELPPPPVTDQNGGGA